MPSILIIDDHALILEGTLNLLSQQYPDTDFLTAQTAEDGYQSLQDNTIDLLVMDLSLPQKTGMTAEVDTGLNFLKTVLKSYPQLNIMVQSSYINALTRIKHEIDNHEGGFTVADKGISPSAMLTRVTWAMQGVTHTKDLKTGLEVKPQWLEVLRLAFEEGLQDKAIAKQMCVSERMVRHYWSKIQDILEIYPEEDKNLRILTLKRAREEGLID
jgi:DNA-binding NarL/FixJ family response regulator